MSKGKILIIDDNHLNRELSAELLEDEGYQVVLAENADAGLAEAKNHRPDLILLDLHLPDHDGFTLARRLKTTEGLQEIPIAAFTAMTMPDAQSRALKNGCCRVITKPIDLDRFIRIIDECLTLNGTPAKNAIDSTPQEESRQPEKIVRTENAGYVQHLETLAQHDLKSPLCSSKTALEVLLSGKLGDLNARQRDLVTEALTSHSQVLELLNNLHGLFLYDRNQFNLTLAPVEIESLMLEVLAENVGPLIEERGLKLSLDFERPYQPQWVGRQELKKALQMLCRHYAQILTTESAFRITIQYRDNAMQLRLGGLQDENVALSPNQPTAGDRLALDYCQQVFQSLHAELQLNPTNAAILFSPQSPAHSN